MLQTGGNSHPSVSAEVMQRKYRTAMRCMGMSCFALAVGLVALLASSSPEWLHWVYVLLWNHVLVIGLVAFAGLAIRRLPRREAGPAQPRPRELLAPWVLAVGLLAALATAGPWGPPIWDLGTTTDGQAVTSLQTRSDGPRFFERVNHGAEREITEAEYLAHQQGVLHLFARFWVAFSFGALLMWRFVALRWRAELAAPAAQLSFAPPQDPAAAGWKQSAVVIGIWALVIGSGLSDLAGAPSAVLCADDVGDAIWLVLLMPPIVAVGAALFCKRAPFDAPWLAALVDERFGAGSYTNFFKRLKPMLLMATGALSSAAVLAVQCSSMGVNGLRVPGAFMLSAGVAFALAHGVLRWRRIPGV